MILPSKPIVSLVKTTDATIEEDVHEAITLLGEIPFHQYNVVAIKPNLSSLKSASSGATTDPAVVEALIKTIRRSSSCKICIVEAHTSHASADKTFDVLGYRRLEEQYPHVNCVNLSRDKRVKVTVDGKFFSTLRVPETMIFADAFINVAKLKTHIDYRYSGILKNTYGFLLTRNRDHYHGFMKEILVDLNSLYRPTLSLIDGGTGMEGFGPLGGTPKPVGVLVASRDPVAADTIGAQIMGIKPSSIKYLQYAWKQEIGEMTGIEVRGCQVHEVSTKFQFIPTKLYYLGRVALQLQRLSRYNTNFTRLLQLVRSSLSTMGLSGVSSHLSTRDMLQLVKTVAFRNNV
jgi:uncharacterized protein (DUF362 family)